jgi:hypothetical protein
MRGFTTFVLVAFAITYESLLGAVPLVWAEQRLERWRCETCWRRCLAWRRSRRDSDTAAGSAPRR